MCINSFKQYLQISLNLLYESFRTTFINTLLNAFTFHFITSKCARTSTEDFSHCDLGPDADCCVDLYASWFFLVRLVWLFRCTIHTVGCFPVGFPAHLAICTAEEGRKNVYLDITPVVDSFYHFHSFRTLSIVGSHFSIYWLTLSILLNKELLTKETSKVSEQIDMWRGK